jgi:hypothetical protein
VTGGVAPAPAWSRPFPHPDTAALADIAREFLTTYAHAFVARDFDGMGQSFGFPLILVEHDTVDIMIRAPDEPVRLSMLRDLFEDMGFVDRRLAACQVRALSEHCLLALVRWHYIDDHGAARRAFENAYLIRRQADRWTIRGVVAPDRQTEMTLRSDVSAREQMRPDWAPLAAAARTVFDHQRDVFRDVDIRAYARTYLFPTLLSWPAGNLVLRDLADVRDIYARFRDTFDAVGIRDARVGEVRIVEAGGSFMLAVCAWQFLDVRGVRIGWGTARYLLRRRAEGWRVAMVAWDEDDPLNLDPPAERVH